MKQHVPTGRDPALIAGLTGYKPGGTDFYNLCQLVLGEHTPAKVPHRRRLRAVAEDGLVNYSLASNWPRTKWYLYASQGGWRHGQPRATTSPEVAESWLRLFAYDALRDTVQKYAVRKGDGAPAYFECSK